MGVQSRVESGVGMLGCKPRPHSKGLQRDGEGVPEESELPLSGQGWQVDAEIAPRAVE
jgi:hypothetical protein